MTILAVGCHPDDIEFMMSGTLLLLKDTGAQLHYLAVANGSCGTDRYTEEEIVRIRRGEAIRAAEYLGAAYHESFVGDLEVFYEQSLIRKLAAVIRDVRPDVILTQSLEDYMEDHMNTARTTVTAAFCRGMRNFGSLPPRPPVAHDVMIYHATPHIISDAMRRPIVPEMYVNVEPVMERKREMLAYHRSQKEWLDVSQGFDSYLQTMQDITRAVGALSGRFPFAEGWRRHSHVGFSARDGNPLAQALPGLVHVSPPPAADARS